MECCPIYFHIKGIFIINTGTIIKVCEPTVTSKAYFSTADGSYFPIFIAHWNCFELRGIIHPVFAHILIGLGEFSI